MRLRELLPFRRKVNPPNLSPVDNRGSWWPVVEWATGAWQTNATPISTEDALSYWAVFRCISIISSDIAKMDLRLVEETDEDIYVPADSPAFSPVIRKPNDYQNAIQFIENWLQSKLSRGNTYVLKQRDNRGVVIRLFVLDPLRCRPLVSAPGGEVFYELNQDYLTGVETQVTVPASEIIHDRWNTFYHPLVGLSPLHASGISALMGRRIQDGSSVFFGNGSQPGGILTAPGIISDETAQRLKQHWETNYSGNNSGKVAVLGDGLKFEPMRQTAVDAQLVEQLKWTDAIIAGAFGVPAYMINAGTAPAYNNVEALNQQYYSQCLQIHIKSIEKCLSEGLGLEATDFEVKFELDDLLRMDTSTMVSTLQNAVKGILTANEARKKLGYGTTDGGDTVLTQQQNVSIDAAANQVVNAPAAPQSAPQPDQPSNDNIAAAFIAMRKGFQHA